MSLKVWLPFNSDLGNIGLETDAVISTSGSIDTTYTVLGNGSKSSASITLKKNYLGYTGSICFWVYVTPEDTRTTYFGKDSTSASSTNRKWALHAHPTRNDLNSWGCMKDTSAAENGGFTLSGVCPDNTWTHVAWCHDESKEYIYINGELKRTCNWDSTGDINFDSEFPIRSYSGRYMNDLRIYDHCLSAKEVNEIAKGLLFHAKLDSIGDKPGNPNMLGHTYYPDALYISFGSTTSHTSEMVDCGGGIHSRKFTVNADPTNWHYIGLSTSSFYPRELKANSKYTFSFWLKTNKERSFTIRILNSNGTNPLSSNIPTLKSIGDSQWHKYSATWTTVDDVSIASGQVIYFHGLEFVGTYEFKMLKLEEGDTATGWVPRADKDEMYNKLGYNNDRIKYSAPYSNNPIANNGVSNAVLVNNSVINERCLKIVDSSSGGLFFSGPWKSGIKLNNCSFSIWASVSVSNGNIFGIGYNTGIRCRVEQSSLNSFWVYTQIHNPTTDTTDVRSNYFNIPSLKGDDSMHHYVITWNNGYLTLYLDGVRISTSDVTNSGTQLLLSSYGGVIGSFNGSTEVQPGRFSDFRVYAKTLTDEDVKELYSVREAIDKSGNLYCAEYKEDELSNTGFEKCGIVHSKSFSELPAYFDSNVYIEEIDNSLWLRIFHHNNPVTNGRFSTSDPFTQSFYKNANLWWNMPFCNYIDKWEILIKQKKTSTGDLLKYRWVQSANPMEATFNEVSPDKTRVELSWGDEYLYNKDVGGIRKLNSSNAYLAASYGSDASLFYGAIGCITAFQTGIPAYGETANAASSAITTGFLDLYIRIDNVNFSKFNIKASIAKNNTIYGNIFIED